MLSAMAPDKGAPALLTGRVEQQLGQNGQVPGVIVG